MIRDRDRRSTHPLLVPVPLEFLPFVQKVAERLSPDRPLPPEILSEFTLAELVLAKCMQETGELMRARVVGKQPSIPPRPHGNVSTTAQLLTGKPSSGSGSPRADACDDALARAGKDEVDAADDLAGAQKAQNDAQAAADDAAKATDPATQLQLAQQSLDFLQTMQQYVDAAVIAARDAQDAFNIAQSLQCAGKEIAQAKGNAQTSAGAAAQIASSSATSLIALSAQASKSKALDGLGVAPVGFPAAPAPCIDVFVKWYGLDFVLDESCTLAMEAYIDGILAFMGSPGPAAVIGGVFGQAVSDISAAIKAGSAAGGAAAAA